MQRFVHKIVIHRRLAKLQVIVFHLQSDVMEDSILNPRTRDSPGPCLATGVDGGRTEAATAAIVEIPPRFADLSV